MFKPSTHFLGSRDADPTRDIGIKILNFYNRPLPEESKRSLRDLRYALPDEDRPWSSFNKQCTELWFAPLNNLTKDIVAKVHAVLEDPEIKFKSYFHLPVVWIYLNNLHLLFQKGWSWEQEIIHNYPGSKRTFSEISFPYEFIPENFTVISHE